jgi:hypothetical protein
MGAEINVLLCQALPLEIPPYVKECNWMLICYYYYHILVIGCTGTLFYL